MPKGVCETDLQTHEALLGWKALPVVPEQEGIDGQESKTSLEYTPHIAKAQVSH